MEGEVAEQGVPFAQPGVAGELFCYGGVRDGTTLDGPYAVVDVETTGWSPGLGDRAIEIAVARVDAAGRIEDEYATLLNPEGRDVGATFLHGITNDAALDAPEFGDIAGEILARLDGAVVVAHNAAFEDRFLAAELARAGLAAPQMPALCTLWLSRHTFGTPNHKLRTLCRHADIPAVDAHAALGDVRAVATLLPTMLHRCQGPLAYRTPAPTMPTPPRSVAGPKTRAPGLRKGADGWIASLMSRLPMSAAEATDAEAEAYLAALSQALEDGKLVGHEAKALAKLAGRAGMGAAQVAALNERFLESMRAAAFDDEVLTSAELNQLRSAADLLGSPGYFDDLRPTGPSAPEPARQRRCGHCRQPGHYRSTCPELTG